MAAYYAHVMEFSRLFTAEQRKVHGAVPDFYYQFVTPGATAGGSPLEVVYLERGATELEKKPKKEITHRDFDQVFSAVLSILDTRRLMLCTHDARLRTEKALVAAETRFTISQNSRHGFGVSPTIRRLEWSERTRSRSGSELRITNG